MNILINHHPANFNSANVRFVLSEIEGCEINTQESLKVKRRIFSVSVEALQNLVKHQYSTASGSASFLLSKGSTGFQIQTVNAIKKNKKEALKNKLTHLNRLTLTELKEQHQLSIKNQLQTYDGSAGLGLIQMARKSEKKLEYDFVDLNEEFALFQLTVNISKK